MNENLKHAMKELRLSGMSLSLEVRLQEAKANNLDYDEFLELALQDEMTVRYDRQIKRRIKSAAFAGNKTLDQFNWNFNQKISRKQYLTLQHVILSEKVKMFFL